MSKRSNITGEPHNRWGSLSGKLWAATTLVALLFPLTAIANPAHAASQTVAIDCSTSVTVATTPVALQVGDTLTISSSNCRIVNLAPGAVGVATYGPSGTGSTVIPGAANALALGDTVIYTATAVGAAFLDVVDGSPPKGVAYSITVNALAPAAPQTDQIALDIASGYRCNVTQVEATRGTWIELPKVSECTPPATKPRAVLLGWATSPTFPVATAKRQVANGWGAYETFDASGSLTGVFIPEGKSTLVSTASTLHSIWSE